MRLWSLSPSYLDRLGLLGVWREALLAQQVLAGRTEGYQHHPQLNRFQSQENPLSAIGTYLKHIAQEAQSRSYQFDTELIIRPKSHPAIPVTRGQLNFERTHLLKKLHARDPERYMMLDDILHPDPHPSFTVIPGPVASWERGTV